MKGCQLPSVWKVLKKEILLHTNSSLNWTSQTHLMMSPTSNRMLGLGHVCRVWYSVEHSISCFHLASDWRGRFMSCGWTFISNRVPDEGMMMTERSEETSPLGKAYKRFSRSPAQMNDLNGMTSWMKWNFRQKDDSRSGPWQPLLQREELCYFWGFK